jgi:hypothetical protein
MKTQICAAECRTFIERSLHILFVLRSVFSAPPQVAVQIISTQHFEFGMPTVAL